MNALISEAELKSVERQMELVEEIRRLQNVIGAAYQIAGGLETKDEAEHVKLLDLLGAA